MFWLPFLQLMGKTLTIYILTMLVNTSGVRITPFGFEVPSNKLGVYGLLLTLPILRVFFPDPQTLRILKKTGTSHKSWYCVCF